MRDCKKGNYDWNWQYFAGVDGKEQRARVFLGSNWHLHNQWGEAAEQLRLTLVRLRQVVCW